MEILRGNRCQAPTPTVGELYRSAGVIKRDVSLRLGVSAAAPYHWEHGTAWPSIDKLPAMAELLGVSVETLVLALIKTRGGGGRG